MADSKPIDIWSQPISGVSAINSSIAFYDIYGRKGEVFIILLVYDTFGIV
jgi:hypothetical protein